MDDLSPAWACYWCDKVLVTVLDRNERCPVAGLDGHRPEWLTQAERQERELRGEPKTCPPLAPAHEPVPAVPGYTPSSFDGLDAGLTWDEIRRFDRVGGGLDAHEIQRRLLGRYGLRKREAGRGA